MKMVYLGKQDLPTCYAYVINFGQMIISAWESHLFVFGFKEFNAFDLV